MRVAVVGAGGYVGLATAVGLAALGHEVRGLERDSSKNDSLNAGRVPMQEPGLAELLEEALADGTVRFTDDAASALASVDFVFLAVGTPPDESGRPDLSQMDSAAAAVAAHAPPDAVVVVKSTLPPGGLDGVDGVTGPRPLVSFPEFLREGMIVEDFFRPWRLVIGGPAEAVESVLGLVSGVVDGTHPLSRGESVAVVRTDRRTASLCKYASNAYLATRVSFANEILRMSEALGADAEAIIGALALDPRIGARYLRAGVGYGGPCLPKDLRGLAAVGRDHGVETPLLEGVDAGNAAQRRWTVGQVARAAGGLAGKRVLVLGLTFKPETSDTRDSVPVDVARDLVGEGARVVAYDPAVSRDEWPEGLERTEDPAAVEADAVALLVGDAGLLAAGVPDAPLFDPWRVA